jgi:hypothetical protein
MGLFDWFARPVRCPGCGDDRARQALFGRIRCPNRACAYFDSRLASGFEQKEAASPPVSPSPQRENNFAKPKAAFNPAGRLIQVQYKNYRGEEKIFSGDPRTLRRRHKHISLCVSPSGIRIALNRKRILNLDEVDAELSKTPTPREQAVLSFHKRRGSTSPLFERLQTKYPHW